MVAEKMTRRERLMTAIRCGEPDRPPVRVYNATPSMRNWGHPSFRKLVDLAIEHTEVFDGIGIPGGPAFAACFDLNARISEEPIERPGYVRRTTVYPTPRGDLYQVREDARHCDMFYVSKYFIETVEDADRFLSVPDDPILFDVSTLFRLEDEVGDAGIVELCCNDPGFHIHWLMGSETMAIWSIEKRDLLHAIYDKMQVRYEALLKRCLPLAPGRVFYAGSAERWIPPLQSPRDFEEFEWTTARSIADIVHENGGYFHYHCDGRVGNFLTRFADAGVDILNPVQPPPMGDVTLTDAKRLLRGRTCIEGNIEWGDLITSTTDEIRRLTARTIEEGSPGGGFILMVNCGPHQSPVLTDDLFEKWLAFIETGIGATVA